jgi:hypothetical protein
MSDGGREHVPLEVKPDNTGTANHVTGKIVPIPEQYDGFDNWPGEMEPGLSDENGRQHDECDQTRRSAAPPVGECASGEK